MGKSSWFYNNRHILLPMIKLLLKKKETKHSNE